MKNHILTLSLLLTAFCAFGQVKSSIDLVSGLDYTYRTLGSDGGTSSTVVSVLNKSESPGASWRAGFNYNVQLADRVTLKTGLRYAVVGYTLTKQDTLRWPSQHNGNGGYDPSLPGEGNGIVIKNHYRLIELPLVVRYQMQCASNKQRKWNSYLEAGFAPNVYTSTRYMTKFLGNKTVDTYVGDKIRKLHWVAQLSYGVAYQLKNADQLFCQSTARYHLNTTDDAPVKEHLYSFGLEFGYRKLLFAKEK